MKLGLCWRLGLLWALLSSSAGAVDTARLDYQLQPRQVAPGIWVVEGAVEDFSRDNGCNIINTGFVSNQAGTLVINTGPSRLYGEQQRAALARTTAYPVKKVVSLNLHPDYFFGNQAWRDVSTAALSGSKAGMQAEGLAYEDNLYRLCGDWMRGTEFSPSRDDIEPGRFDWGGHALEWVRMQGHTDDDLLLIDHTTGVLFAGGLVFADRVPTVPHAHIERWIESLQVIRQWINQGQVKIVVPSHGPVHPGTRGVDQTLDWLQWLHERMQTSAAQGLDMAEVLHLPVPERFESWAALAAEYARNVTTLYPRYESEQLSLPVAQTATPK